MQAQRSQVFLFRKYILPALAVFGLMLGISTVRRSSQTPPLAEPLAQPPQVPFSKYVAGAGVIESSSENISIASAVSGLVTQVYVAVGDRVVSGAPLFSLDDRALRAELEVRRAALAVAKNELDDNREQYALRQRVTDKRAVSEDELSKRLYAMKVSEAKVQQAQAQLEATQTELERLIVRAPISGQLLQVKIRPGEYAPAQLLASPLMVMGTTEVLHVRVDVDENDAWRVHNGAPAWAYLRGNSTIGTALEFVRTEPLVVPKRSLTGDSTERVDTRVFQVLYRFSPSSMQTLVGQLVDVYIEADE